MNTRHLIPLVASLGFLGLASAQTVSPVQSAARPYDLDIAAPVMVAGSDEASKAFQTEVLPGMLKLVQSNLTEAKSLKNLGEGAGYRNSLGISTTGDGPLGEDARLIFPDASSPAGYGGTGSLVRDPKEPLLAGDFVDLGKFKAGTALDFFLIANGATGGKEFYTTDQSENRDGIIHAVSLAANGSAYLIIGFEDMKDGGDMDYNDVMFAVEIGKQNVETLTETAGLAAPEPSLPAGMLLTASLVLGLTPRRVRGFRRIPGGPRQWAFLRGRPGGYPGLTPLRVFESALAFCAPAPTDAGAQSFLGKRADAGRCRITERMWEAGRRRSCFLPG